MIKNCLKSLNIETYKDSYPMLYIALNYLQQNDVGNFENGTYEIIKDKMKIIITEYNTKDFNQDLWESHKIYTDVQYIIRGAEKIFYTDIAGLQPITEYNKDKDIMFYRDANRHNSSVLKEGDFIVFEPCDAHMPSITPDVSAYVKKAIIKFKA